ncbi:MAG: hypothetical protein D6805_05800 [Planctomycetota bacterium]|nr:MAG: hypothetical protein D6805_05800 [Planctomycetota bacterium]
MSVSSNKIPLCFVVALECEAAPFKRYYQLKLLQSGLPFSIYWDTKDLIYLVVSGVGKAFAAAAVAYLYTKLGERKNMVWLNVGVAGHRERELGELCLAHKILDLGSDLCFYPPLVFETHLVSECVATSDVGVRDYPENFVYEMEAAGFYQMALKCSSAELVQVIKIISDNQHQGLDQLKASKVEELIGQNMVELDGFAKKICSLSSLLPRRSSLSLLEKVEARFHFTFTQRQQLKFYLEKILFWEREEELLFLFDLPSGRKVLEALKKKLSEYVYEP